VPSEELKRRVRLLPREPGCYLWKDAKGGVLYVGKAQDLRARASSYLSRALEARIHHMMEEAADIDFVATRTVPEALVLEQNLVKLHTPPYNVMMVDDKKYPYIAVTAEKYPRVVYTRSAEGHASVFGPFPEAGSAKRVARMLNKSFKLRQCRVLPKRECLYYHMHQCTAPCIGAVTDAEYQAQAKAAAGFLAGQGAAMVKDLRNQMDAASAAEHFEEAAELRDTMQAVESVLHRQYAETRTEDDADAVGLAIQGDRACACVLFIRSGRLVGKEHFFLSHTKDVPPPEVLRAFLERHYFQSPQVPRHVLVAFALEDTDALVAHWSQRSRQGVGIHVPERRERRRFVDLAEKNAELLLEQELLIRERQGAGGLDALKTALGLAEPPATIEAFDISHHKGEHTVASLVCLKDGRPFKSRYRRFRIRSTSGGDDPGAMREVVSRRYERLLREEGADALPDLILIDGGPTQLAAAMDALAALGLDGLFVLGLAKKLEEIYRPNRLAPLRLPQNSPALHVLQRVRDEAHRFAIGYQDTLKRKALTRSVLDEVTGVGPEIKRRLLATFGSLEGIRRASAEEISRVPGVSRPLAARIAKALKPED
jgi:excinuclease ABC subunit C